MEPKLPEFSGPTIFLLEDGISFFLAWLPPQSVTPERVSRRSSQLPSVRAVTTRTLVDWEGSGALMAPGATEPGEEEVEDRTLEDGDDGALPAAEAKPRPP